MKAIFFVGLNQDRFGRLYGFLVSKRFEAGSQSEIDDSELNVDVIIVL